MPVLKMSNSKSTHQEYALSAIRDIFEFFTLEMVGLEIQQAFTKQGVTSTFKTGRGFGLLEGILVGLKIPYTLIKPKSWQSVMFDGLAKDDTKKLSGMVAQRLYPKQDFRASPRCKNIHDGMTDALMIALFTKKQL
jgi:crossover junction endodeoxyribonuclease RuvC